jgi:cystathionine beta-lyase/cystathionine gamma-synthase
MGRKAAARTAPQKAAIAETMDRHVSKTPSRAMKTLTERMQEIDAALSPTARMFVPKALIALLIDICKTLDAKSPGEKS